MAYYLDTSAAVKLVVAERDTTALTAWLGDHDDEVVSGDLLRTELLRATRRGAPHAMPRAPGGPRLADRADRADLHVRAGGRSRS